MRMNVLKVKYLGIGLVLATIAAMVVPNFVFAQDAPNDPPPGKPSAEIIIGPIELGEANVSLEACFAFREKVFNATGKQFKAIWPYRVNESKRADSGLDPKYTPLPPGEGMCFIVPATFPDVVHDGKNILGDHTKQPQGSKDLQNLLLQSQKGITSTDLTSARFKDQEEQTQAGPVSKVIGWIINLLLGVVAFFIGILTSIAGEIMVIAIRWTTVTSMPDIVNVGWSIVRDFANMFFILIMIVIAIAAILRIEEYDYRHLLGEVIIMAILVNFSKVIAVTLINITNFLVSIFAINSFAEIASFMWGVASGNTWSFPSGGWMSALVQGLTKIVFMLVALAAFLALAGLFVVRLVGLYVLVIFSPMAYVLDILPPTKNIAHQWWHKFIEYLIWAPVAMFMIRLAVLIVDKGGLQLGGTSAFENSNDSTFNYIILMAFLWGAVIVAEHAGMVGGNAVIQGAEKFTHNLAHMGTHYAGRKWNEWTGHMLEQHGDKPVGLGKKVLFAALNPVAVYKGAHERSHELGHMAGEMAKAGGREVAEQFVTGGWKGKAQLKIPYRQFAERKDEDNFLKEYGNMKKESVMQAALDAKDLGGYEGAARKRAIVKAAAANGYLDDLLRMREFAEQYGDEDGTIYSAEVLNRFLYGYLGDNEQAKRFMAEDMEELGKKTKHYEYLGHAYYDNKTGKFERGMKAVGTKKGIGGQDIEDLDNTWQAKYSVSEFAKLGGRDRVGAAPHNFTVIRAKLERDADGNIMRDKNGKATIVADKDGHYSQELGGDQLTFGRETGRFDKFNTHMLEKMDADVMREIQHAQERVKEWLVSEDAVVPNSNGAILIKDEAAMREIKELYRINPEFVRGLYTKVLRVKGDNWENLDNIRFVYENDVDREPIRDNDGEVTHTVVKLKSKDRVKVLDESKPASFTYVDGQGLKGVAKKGDTGGGGGGSAPKGPSPAERSEMSGAREFDIDDPRFKT